MSESTFSHVVIVLFCFVLFFMILYWAQLFKTNDVASYSGDSVFFFFLSVYAFGVRFEIVA